MAEYKCFSCGKSINPENVKKRVRCVYCGAKILYKVRTASKVVDAI